MARVSIIITSYNQKEYLVEAIESVLSQTLMPAQIIVVDDCSTDGSREVIEGYRSRLPELFTPIYHERNTGVTCSRIDAMNAVTGAYVTHVDGDDRILPEKLEKEARALKENPSARIAYSNFFYMDPEGVRTGTWAGHERPPEGYVFKEVFARDFPDKTLFRNELVDYGACREIGFHDPSINLYEDYELRIRLAKRLRTVYVDEPLSEYRLHGRGLSRAAPAAHIEALEYIYEKNRHLLDDLDPADRRYVQRKLHAWMARVAGSAVRSSLMAGRPVRAAAYMIKALRLELRSIKGNERPRHAGS